MYTPKHFEEKDKSRLVKFMKDYNFAELVTSVKGTLWATHLPFVVVPEGNEIILHAHMAKANPQWKSFEDLEALVIFSEPHSYISQELYDTKISVPTWNYADVHAYGVPEIRNSLEERIATLELSFEHFDLSFKDQWKSLPKDYKNKLLRGIVAFRIKVTRLEGKFKLSQNRSEKEREKIINKLSQSSMKTRSNIALLMKEREHSKNAKNKR